MLRPSGDQPLLLPAVALACLGVLQPGIDPVFLTLLSSAHGLSPDRHGWIVSASQCGMALGALVTWQYGRRLSGPIFPTAALVALLAALATAWTGDFALLLGLRCLFGLATGVLYTQAMSNAAAHRPHGAYGAVFLCQLGVATAVALLLPTIADTAGAAIALATLAIAPLCALAICVRYPQAVSRREPATPARASGGPGHSDTRAWAAAGATLLFICATMMVWSFAGALAIDAGISEATIGQAVAVGSLAGAATAFFVMRERPAVPPALTGPLSGLSLICPILATRDGDPILFIVSIILLNIGSTAIIVRSSGLASAAGRDGLFRRFVACTHPLGMTLGPVAGSLASLAFGAGGLLYAAVTAILSACLLLAFADLAPGGLRWRRTSYESLDEYLTNVQP